MTVLRPRAVMWMWEDWRGDGYGAAFNEWQIAFNAGSIGDYENQNVCVVVVVVFGWIPPGDDHLVARNRPFFASEWTPAPCRLIMMQVIARRRSRKTRRKSWWIDGSVFFQFQMLCRSQASINHRQIVKTKQSQATALEIVQRWAPLRSRFVVLMGSFIRMCAKWRRRLAPGMEPSLSR